MSISDDPTAAQEWFPALSALKAAHVELLERRRVTGDTPELLAEITAFIRRGIATGALLETDNDRWASQSVLDYWANVSYRAGSEQADATLAEFDPALAPELADALCPYVGLDAFRELNYGVFFGRQQLIAELVERLKDSRLLAVVGPSGSGKSSLVLGGLVPALKGGALPGSQSWRYLPTIVPGSDPLRALARALQQAREAGQQVAGDHQHIDGANGADGATPINTYTDGGAAPLVLVVDQFEELFTLCEDDAARRAFIDGLLELLRAPSARHTLILTMRSDFESYVARLPALQHLFEHAQVRVTPLNAGELREAIAQPAELVGLKFEDGLIDALAQDILGEPAALPLLQFTLLKLWEHREHNWVTWDAYRRLGGGRLALARSADAFFAGLIPEEQVTARRILLRMVRPGEGLEVTSNRVRRATLYQTGEAPDRIDRVLDKLVRARLVRLTIGDTPADTQVEVAHEALVRNWPRLVSWLEEEKAALSTRRRLEAKAVEWERLGQGSSGLLDDVQLLEAQRWLASSDAAELGYADSLPALVQASRAAIEERRRIEAAQQFELARAQTLAEASRLRAEEQDRAATQTRRFAAVLLLLLLLAVASAAIALTQASVARRNAAEAQNLTLSIGAQAALHTGNTDLALTLAMTASHMDQPAFAAQLALAEAAYAPGTRRHFVKHTAEVQSVAFSPDGRTMLSGANDATMILWDVASGQPIRTFTGHTAGVQSVAFSPDGRSALSCAKDHVMILWNLAGGTAIRTFGVPAATANTDRTVPACNVAFSPDGRTGLFGAEDSTVLLWDLATGRQLRSFALPQPNTSAGTSASIIRVGAVAFSPDGRTVLAGAADNSLILWDATTGQELRRFAGHTDKINSVAFSPDGRTALSGSTDMTMILWDVATGQVIRRFTGHNRDVFSVAFSPDGRTALSGSRDGRVGLWNVQTGAPIHFFVGHGAAVQSVAFSPDGRNALSGSLDFEIRLWDIDNGAEIRHFVGHTARVIDAVFSPDGRTVVSASGDNSMILWDVASGQPLRRFVGHKSAIAAVAFSPDGRSIISGSTDTTLILWDVATGKPIRTLTGHTLEVSGVAFSPDGRSVLSAGGDKTLILWDVATGKPIRTLTGHTSKVNGVAFSPDGRTALSASRDTTLILWDVATGTPIRTYSGHKANVRAVAFSPDGRTALSGAEDKSIILWDVATGKPIRTFSEHNAAVWDVAFSADGRLALSGSDDTTLIVWDVASGQAIRRFTEHSAAVRSVAFSQDGHSILSGSNDNTLILWRFDTLDELIAWANNNRYIPEPTCDQRRIYRLAPLCPDQP